MLLSTVYSEPSTQPTDKTLKVRLAVEAKDKVLKEQLFILRVEDGKVGELCETLRQTLHDFEDYKAKVQSELAMQSAKLEALKMGGKKRKFEQSL